jgi:EmrB/QacA subfamily drug resistance transporter
MRHRGISQRAAVCVVYVAAMFMSILDATIVNVAFPAMAHAFHVPVASMSSVAVGFLLSVAVVIPACGWLGERCGTKRVFLAALLVFTAASALCGTAQSLTELVACRALQGVGAGAITPTGLTLLMHVFTPAERVRASRVLSVPTTLAAVSGPILGGVIVDQLDWRWVFYLNVPLGLALTVFGRLFLVEPETRRRTRFDLPGFLLSSVGFAGVTYAISDGAARGWTSPPIATATLLGLAALAALIVVERRARQPLLSLRLLGDRLFSAVNVVSLLAGASFMGTLFVYPLMLQAGFGKSALAAGLMTFPEAVGVMAGTQLASRVYPRLGPRKVLIIGMAGVTLATLLLTRVNADTSPWLARLLLLLLGLSIAQEFLATSAAAFARIAKRDVGRASALFSTQIRLSGALGAGAMGTVLAAMNVIRDTPAGPRPHIAAYHAGFIAAAAMAVAAGLVSLLIRDADTAATMLPTNQRPDEASEEAAIVSDPVG